MRRRDLLALAAAAPLVACSRRALRDDAPLELVVANDATTLDPRYASDVYGLRVSRLVHATLLSPHPDTLAPEPWLASSVEEESGGALVVTLRAGATFHDGTRVTARDVIATWAAACDANMAMPARRIAIEATVDAVDGDAGSRVRFTPKRPNAMLRSDLDMAILKADETRRARDATLTGSGPFPER